MRVTSGMLALSFTERLHQRGRMLWDSYDQIASGKRVRVPGDDPAATARIMQLQRQLAEQEQYQANVGESKLWLELTDSSLAMLGDLLSRARELAVAGANDTMSPESRQGLANEVDQLFQHAIQLGNSTAADRHLFAGQRTLGVPFRVIGPNEFEYLGDTGVIGRQVGRGTSIAVNVTGDAAVSPVLEALAALAEGLRTGDADFINQTVLGQIDVTSDQVLAARAEVGAKISRLENNESKSLDEKVNVTRQLSDRQDADLPSALMGLRLAEAGYEAALSASARVMQLTLVDFLR